MLNTKRSWLFGMSSLVMVLTIVTSFLVVQTRGTHASGPGSQGSQGIQGVPMTVSSTGTTSFASAAPGTDHSVQIGSEYDKALFNQDANGSNSSSSGSSARPTINRSFSGFGKNGSGENTAGNIISAQPDPQLGVSFDGLNHFQQRFANGGNQFSLEPPDQGLCTGNGHVMEVVNDVIQVYTPSGTPLLNGGAAVDLNTFFGYPAAIHRAPPRKFGPFVTDPSCYFDQPTQRWFVDVLTLDVNKKTGAFLGPNHLDIAVSTTASPTGTFVIYRIPVQDDGTQGTPNHKCDGSGGPGTFGPCLGDYPHIGADANGFYITTNEYGLFAPPTDLGFHAAQIYAISKSALAANNPIITVTQFDTIGAVNGNPGFTVWPAETPGSGYATVAGGTEFFLSSDAAPEAKGTGTSTDLIVWALTKTQALTIGGTLTLRNFVQSVLPYTIPPLSEQKAGNVPQADCLNTPSCATILLGGPDPFAPEQEFSIFSNDTRMQQVVYENGLLWGALDTGLKFGKQTNAGIEWFVVAPSVLPFGLTANPVANGYLGFPDVNMTYPAIAVTASGKAEMAFTLLGPNDYPSAAYADLNIGGVQGVHIAAAGVGPDDGFTGYPGQVGPIVPPEPRWGDYGAAVADGGSIWIASEYIGQTCTFATYLSDFTCGKTRSALANWDTRISRIDVG